MQHNTRNKPKSFSKLSGLQMWRRFVARGNIIRAWKSALQPTFPPPKFSLTDAQLVIAREHGFESWPRFVQQINKLNRDRTIASLSDPVAAFLKAATWHGTLDEAQAILAAYPEVARSNIHAAAVLGDEATVRQFLARDAGNATAKAAPYGTDALVYLSLSKYLRLDEARSGAFLRTATALLDGGAIANSGFWTKDDHPEFETALYGAAGVAHHAGMTRLLLDWGADPNDGEVAYHSPETGDNAALQLLVESGKLSPDTLATMLLRKADWHDYDGIKFLLEHGADPNRMTVWRLTALHQALRRDNGLQNIEAMLDHGADPTSKNGVDGRSAISIAVRRGRADVLELFRERGIPLELEGVERLIAACAMNDTAAVGTIAANEPELVREVIAEGGKLLAEFAGTANGDGVRQLLDLGVSVNALFREGYGYFDIAKDSTALHVAAWKAWHKVVKLLIERGAAIDALDAKERTPLALAVRACVNSYWAYRRSPESVEALLMAGASAGNVDYPSGYQEVDDLLRPYLE